MSIIAVGSVKASPGVTSLSVGLGLSWESTTGRRAVLIEADGDGGVLAARFGLVTTPSLVELSGIARHGLTIERLQTNCQLLGLKLMEVVDSRGSLVGGRSDGRQRAAAQDAAPFGGASPFRGGDGQRGGDVPLLRHQPAGVLQAATASRSWAPTGSGTGRRARATAPGPPRPRWSPRSCICASTTASAL